MQIQKKVINGHTKDVLILSIWEQEDIEEIYQRYTDYPCVQISLSSLKHLALFNHIDTLILTGGIPSLEGFSVLYGVKSLKNLVLDYEETDSDDEGIDISAFPNLKYVLSRSNLNILHFNPEGYGGVKIKILNYYSNGKKVRRQCPSSFNLYQQDKFLFFSAEAQNPAGKILMDILLPVERRFMDTYSDVRFSTKLDKISIIPICMEESCLENSFVRERKLVSIKRRYADIRLIIPFELFLFGDSDVRINLCKENIQKAALYISKKDLTFKMQLFLLTIDTIFSAEFS